jgi:hypothetical protein
MPVMLIDARSDDDESRFRCVHDKESKRYGQ